MMHKRFTLLLLLCLPVSAWAAEESSWLDSSKQWIKQLWRDDAQQWLGRVDSAVINHNYKGILVLAQGSKIDTITVDHQLKNGVETLRLQTLSGSQRGLVKQGEKLQTQSASSGNVTINGLTGQQTSFRQFANALDNPWYKVKMGRKGRIAGRPVQQILINASDTWRYSYRLWLDQETALPLKVVTLDEKGGSVEQMVFTQIEITPAGKTENVTKAVPPAPVLESPYAEVKGYRLIAQKNYPASTHYLYSDGLARISLYVETANVREKAQMQKDAVNGLMLADGKTRYVALGKVPVMTLAAVLEATQP